MKQCSKLSAIAIVVLALLVVGSVAVAGVAKQDGQFYVVDMKTAGSGADRVATITVTPKTGYHNNMLYPWKLTVVPSEGVTYKKDVFKKPDAATFTEEKVVFAVPYSATAEAKEVKATLKMSLCDEKQCEMVKLDLVIKA